MHAKKGTCESSYMSRMENTNFQLGLKQAPTPCQTIQIAGVAVVVKRDDMNHAVVQGNKLRKLKHNLLEARHQGAETILTFGGAYSNHLLATAFAAQANGFKSVGLVRGNELADNQAVWSETLFQCKQLGMQLVFVSRADYRMKTTSKVFQAQLESASKPFVLPEGGSNLLALEGVAEIISELRVQLEQPPSHIICPVGTGGTLAGLIKGVAMQKWNCKLFGVAVLKGLQSVKQDIKQWLAGLKDLPDYAVLGDYHAGGYAKNSEELIGFSVAFEQQHQIQLDKIYNSKSFYALAQLIKSGQITTADRPVIIHTGGLQGGVNK